MQLPVVMEKDPEQAMAGRRVSRIDALDWTKGVLIIFMVVYHAINYSVHRPIAFKYLAFLPPSFILITGFLVGQIYATKYDLSSWKPYLRLMVRGGKVLLLFAVFNALNFIIMEKNVYHGLWAFADNADEIFLTGRGRVAIFEVLLPIAYFLLLAPLLLWARARWAGSVVASTVALFAACHLLEKNGISWDNLTLLSAGFIGMSLGLIPIESINRFAANLFAVIGLYAGYRICSYWLGERYWVQMFAGTVTLLLIYAIGLRVNLANTFNQQMIRMGNYSLFAYLAQIAALQVFVRVLKEMPREWSVVTCMIVGTTVFLFLLIRGVHAVRRKNRVADGLYKAAFA
jgi:hypothetical protein